ncbi:MAG: accessory regulator AgrB [Enterococcus sp.]|nr:accessory regulator AgrB [Enterococcus sp.]
MNELISTKMMKVVLNQKQHGTALSEIEFLKFKLGIEIFLINLSKMLVIYGISTILGLLPQTFLFHLSFMVIRISAFGSHAPSSLACTIISLFFFVGFPYVINFYSLSIYVLILCNGVNYLLLYLYAPGKTKKNYLGSLGHQKKLKIRALIGNGLILVISLIVKNPEIKNLMILGALLGGFFVTPISNKIFSINLRKKV